MSLIEQSLAEHDPAPASVATAQKAGAVMQQDNGTTLATAPAAQKRTSIWKGLVKMLSKDTRLNTANTVTTPGNLKEQCYLFSNILFKQKN